MQKRLLNNITTIAPKSKVDLINFAIQKKEVFIAINAEKILRSPDNIKKIINMHIGYPDGIGAVWALKRKGLRDAIKIPGCEIWLDLVEKKVNDMSFYLIGATQDVIKKTVHGLKKDFPKINILNYRNGYIKSDIEEIEIINEIKILKPDVVFVGMGSPKQEIIMNKMHKEHKAIYFGLGGSFDVYTNSISRAPKLWRKYNLEWAFRLFKQPSRIKRQIVYVKFMILLMFNKI